MKTENVSKENYSRHASSKVMGGVHAVGGGDVTFNAEAFEMARALDPFADDPFLLSIVLTSTSTFSVVLVRDSKQCNLQSDQRLLRGPLSEGVR